MSFSNNLKSLALQKAINAAKASGVVVVSAAGNGGQVGKVGLRQVHSERDLARIYTRINAGNSDAALKWYRGFRPAILSLEEQPDRCPATTENDKLRHLLYGSKPHFYRAIFSVAEKRKRVDVLHIRHGARHEFTGSDID